MRPVLLFSILAATLVARPHGCDVACAHDNACVASTCGGSCCEHCGECCPLIKVCRAECSEKEVTHYKYRVECEDFCTAGPSCRHCCEDCCGNCQVCKSPSCGKVRTKRKLVKIEEKEKVPVTKCVVEYLCPTCCDACGCEPMEEAGAVVEPHEAPAAQPTPLPPAPKPAPTVQRRGAGRSVAHSGRGVAVAQ